MLHSYHVTFQHLELYWVANLIKPKHTTNIQSHKGNKVHGSEVMRFYRAGSIKSRRATTADATASAANKTWIFKRKISEVSQKH